MIPADSHHSEVPDFLHHPWPEGLEALLGIAAPGRAEASVRGHPGSWGKKNKNKTGLKAGMASINGFRIKIGMTLGLGWISLRGLEVSKEQLG